MCWTEPNLMTSKISSRKSWFFKDWVRTLFDFCQKQNYLPVVYLVSLQICESVFDVIMYVKEFMKALSSILRCLRLCFMGWYSHHILEYPYTLALACDYLLLELVEELIYYVRPWCSDQKVMPINVHRCLLQTRAVYIITLALHFGCF